MLKAMARGHQESPPRMSMFMSHFSLNLPSLPWRDGDKTPTHHKSPLLSLKLSSRSFLDSSIADNLSEPIYAIKTVDASTTVLRCGGKGQSLYIAMIKWPGVVSTNAARKDDKNFPLIKMRDCHWNEGPVFLRSGSNPDSSRKFTIPDYPQAIKWKRYGASYWCTTSGVKGPIAILDLANGQEPIRLTVYETLHDRYDPQALARYQGVSFLLLDYLIVTALLSVTDVLAWMKVGDAKGIVARHDASSGGQHLGYVPQFHDHSSTVGSDELHDTLSEISTFPQSSSRPYDTGMQTFAEPSLWSSKLYSDTSLVDNQPKDCLEHSITPRSSTEGVQHSGVPPSRIHVGAQIDRSRNISPDPPLPSQYSGSSRSKSSLHPELSRPPDRPHTKNVPSPLSMQQSPLGLGNTHGSLSSEELRNFSRSTHTLSRSESYNYWRPLPKLPGESEVRRIQSLTQLAINSPTINSSHTRNIRTLPAPPLVKVSEQDESRVTDLEDNKLYTPSVTKASQEDLIQWVHKLKDLQRILPSTPSETLVCDLPPPSYASINFTKSNYITTPASPRP